jgi:hypothetical protein
MAANSPAVRDPTQRDSERGAATAKGRSSPADDARAPLKPSEVAHTLEGAPDASTRESAEETAGERRLRTAAQVGYGITALVVFVGWLYTRHYPIVDAQNGFGYWLGIIGASLMATLLLYPLRKRVRFMHVLGATRHWFRMHMIFGVLGPVLILYHCNFSFGSLNDTVALACTLLVAISGLVGRYVYAKVHVDLDGHRATLGELSAKARITAADRPQAASLVPQLLERLTAYDAVVLTPPQSTIASLLLPVKLAVQTRWTATRLIWYARGQLRAQARRSAVIRAERPRLQRAVARFVREHLRRVRRVAELGSYERMFSVWHVFHLPFFYMLVVAALIHVLAVHMY